MLGLVLVLLSVAGVSALPAAGTAAEISSFTLPKSPSGMFHDAASDLLYVLCGTDTNKAHYLYAFNTDGEEQCFITIPEAADMSRVDGFYIKGNKAYIVDSQGGLYRDEKLGGSIYEVEWTNPCGCTASACASATAEWNPTITRTVYLDADEASIADGGGNDAYFRNSGIVVLDNDEALAVNGVHPGDPGGLTCCYPKSLVKVSLGDNDIAAEAVQSWPFTATTLGHDVDMEGLTCGEDACANYVYIGDEWNYVYKLNLSETDPAAAVELEWDLNAIVGDVMEDKGIESITYAPSTGYFYVGIQDTKEVHVVALDGPLDLSVGASTLADCPVSVDSEYPVCTAPLSTGARRVRKEVRTLDSETWDKVVAAMWIMHDTSMEDGVAAYGSMYKPYHYFVAKHAFAQTDTRGDMAHFGPQFPTWHALFNYEFEQAILAVDSTIGAFPYWDATIDTPNAFTDEWLGSADTEEADQRQLVTGKFGNWSVPSSAVLADYVPLFNDVTTKNYDGSPDQFLRAADNELVTPYITRLGSSAGRYDANDFKQCQASSNDYWTWYQCLEANVHGGPHPGIGGKEGNFRGDFEDPVTSPNDPLFFFHHMNVERSFQQYMVAAQAQKCSYYNWPANPTSYNTRGGQGTTFYGMGLEEVLASAWGFTSKDLGLDGVSGAPAGQWTNADVLCWLNPAVNGYTYDTLEECRDDWSLCVAEPTSTPSTPGTTTGEGTCSGTDDRGQDCSTKPPRDGACPPGCTFVPAVEPEGEPEDEPEVKPEVEPEVEPEDEPEGGEEDVDREEDSAVSSTLSLWAAAVLLVLSQF